MASAPSTPKPVSGRIDRGGRLVAADLELQRLQQEAGSRLGAPLALPQLAAIARTARQLGVPVSRRALAAGSDHDVDMWVRAVPEGDDVILSIEQWQARPVAGPRLAAFAGEAAAPATARRWEVDEQLRITRVSPPLADLLGFSLEEIAGQPLTSLFRLQPNEDGSMPLLNGLSARSAFAGQKVGFGTGEAILVVSGQPVFTAGGEFSGFEGSADPPGNPSGAGYSVPDAHVEQLLRAPLDRIIESAGRIVDRSDGPLRNEYAIYAADISAAAHHLLSVVRSMNENPAADGRVVDMVELTEEAVGLVESAAIERDIVIA
jgi:PAS domain-containing protein